MTSKQEAIWLKSQPWKNKAVYVIGGGASLREFDWRLLKDKRTIGCNDAYKLGEEVCNVCIFGDFSWFQKHRERLESYKGIVVTNACQLAPGNIDCRSWVHYIQREPKGLYENALGWNGFTGASAINLSLILSAKTIYLLGFDMGIRKGKTNWHDEIIHPKAVLPSSYQIFKDRWPYVISGLKKFPEQEVINVNDKDTLPGLKRKSCLDHWNEVKNG